MAETPGSHSSRYQGGVIDGSKAGEWQMAGAGWFEELSGWCRQGNLETSVA